MCATLELGDSEGDEEGDVRAEKKRKVFDSGAGQKGGTGRSNGDASKRRGATPKKKPRRSKPSHPYVEVEYEEETEDAATESMSFNW